MAGLERVGNSFAYFALFYLGEMYDSNTESCRSKQARYQLSLPIHIFYVNDVSKA